MAPFYLDTSALVKRYAEERGTVWVSHLTNPTVGNQLYTLRLTAAEMVAALYRKVRTGEVTLVEAQRAEGNFIADWQQQYQIVELTPSVVDRAMLLARRYGLRGYDAVHLAAVLELDAMFRSAGAAALTLISSDRDLLLAAVSEGTAVDDPTNYP